MSFTVNVQPYKDKKLQANATSFDGIIDSEPFVTIDIVVSGEGRVVVFLKNLDDAQTLLDATMDACNQLRSIEFDRTIDEATGNKETEEDGKTPVDFIFPG